MKEWLKKQTEKRLCTWAIIGSLLVVCLCAPFCYAPFWQAGYRAVAAEPLALSALRTVNLNEADAQALCTLPGVGEKKAQAILDYRAEHGPFATVAQVVEVPGISDKMVAEWQGLATV